MAIRSLIASDPVGARRLLDIAAQPSSDASPVTPRESSERETQRALARRLEELRGRATRVVVPGSVLDALSRRLLRSAGASHSGSGLGDAVAERAVALIRAHASLRGSSIAEPCDLSAADFLSSIARAHEETTRDLSDAPPFEARLLSSRDLSRPDVNRASTAAPATRQGVEFGVVPAVVVNGPAARIEDCELELALRESSADSSGGVACAIPPGGEDAIARWLSRLEGALRARHGARASRATLDSAGAPRRLRALRSLEELPEADPVELWEYLSARTPHLPRVADRARRQRLAGLVVLRDVSASMQGPVGRWCARLAAAMVGLAARRGWPVGYVEFNHDARRFRSATAFMHTDHTSLRRLVTRERCDGQTSFEAPLEALLEATREGEWGHAILVTDGLPVVGDPQVAQQRRRLRERGWRVHTLFVGHGAPPPILARIARETRGTSARVRPLPAGRFRLEGTAR